LSRESDGGAYMFGRIHIRLGVVCFHVFRLTFDFFPVNLLLVRSHQAEIMIVKALSPRTQQRDESGSWRQIQSVHWFRFRHSFICQVTSTRRRRSDLSASSQAATYYYQSNHSKVEAIPLSALPIAIYKRTCWPIFTLTLLNAERQAGKL